MSEPTNRYELTYIVNASVEDDTIEETIKKFEDFFKEHQIDVIKSERVGRKRLAYPIHKKNSGFYVTMEFNSLPTFISELERALQLDDYVLRYLTLIIDKKIMAQRAKDQKKVEIEKSKGD